MKYVHLSYITNMDGGHFYIILISLIQNIPKTVALLNTNLK